MKIVYVRTESGFPVGCIATERKGDIILFGVSSYNPLDKFSKSEARKQAADRLSSDPHWVPVAKEKGRTREYLLYRLIELNQEGYKPVSHTVAAVAEEALLSSGQWKLYDSKNLN